MGAEINQKFFCGFPYILSSVTAIFVVGSHTHLPLSFCDFAKFYVVRYLTDRKTNLP